MKKIFAVIFLFIGILLTSILTPMGNTLPKATVASKTTSVGTSALPSIFPTNATFETKAEVIGNSTVHPVGGNDGSNYYAQSFKALSDYITNGGLWLHNYTGMTPNFRLTLCNNTASGWPNVANPMAISQVIANSTINAKPGRFYLNLTAPVRVQQNKTYWLVIDGYYDHATAGAAESIYRGGNPYSDGFFAYSNDAGATWATFSLGDLEFVVNFSNRPNKTEGFGTVVVHPVGGTGSDYYAQSFKALDSYIVDAGIWIAHYVGTTPNFRVQIWANNASGYPDRNNVIASSRVIAGNEIDKSPGRFFVHPNVSISVSPSQTYWLILDGYYDHTTAGTGASKGTYDDVYKDGRFVYSNNAGSSWDTIAIADLNFIVSFSPSRSEMQVDGNITVPGIGGSGLTNYFGQSFKALNKYILDAGVWLENYTNNCPNVRILLCAPDLSGYPNVTYPIATSIPITGTQIMSKPGRYYLQLTKPVEVVPGQTYYLIIDGWYDHTTPASVQTRYRNDNPYTDGRLYASFNAGVSWTSYLQFDLDTDIRFSDISYESQCGENKYVYAVGGSYGSDYYAQSFVAMNDYIADAGIWLEQYIAPTPKFRILLCGNDVDHPDITDIFAMSMVIQGSTIDANPGLFYIKPPTPIHVEVGQTYWIVIDGKYDNVTAGYAQSRGVDFDAYPDGEFKYSNDGVTWLTLSVKDLKFEVIFTHVNQPPTQPNVIISPQKPLDINDLIAYWPIPSTDLESEPITYYIEWYKNSVIQPPWTNSVVVPNSATLPTENWMVKVTPYDGHINGTAGTYTVHVQANIMYIYRSVTAYGQSFTIITTTNTTITDFGFSKTVQGAPANMTFTATGLPGAIGFCNVTIPRTLMDAPWVIIVNGVPVASPDITSNTTHTFIHLTFSTSSVPIRIQGYLIVPEFTPTMLILTIAIITLAIAATKKKFTTKTH